MNKIEQSIGITTEEMNIAQLEKNSRERDATVQELKDLHGKLKIVAEQDKKITLKEGQYIVKSRKMGTEERVGSKSKTAYYRSYKKRMQP